MAVKIAGLEKATGFYGSSVYFYRGVRITLGSGRYSMRYDFDFEHNGKRHRVMASNLIQATNDINKVLGAE